MPTYELIGDDRHAAYRADVGETKRDLGGTLGKIGDLIGGDRS